MSWTWTSVGWIVFALWIPSHLAAQETPLIHTGMCDASAALALNPNVFLVANDEDNTLRAYLNRVSGPPCYELNLSEFLQVNAKHPETDLEGAAQVGRRIYWITSHGQNKDGKFRESRHRFFAIQIVQADHDRGIRLVPEGRPYKHLLRDLLREPRLNPFNLSSASRRPPKEPGALNIEGLSASPGRRLLIGFRNPIPEGKALLVPLLNPDSIIQGKPARFDEPILLDLDGLGIRDIAWHIDQYYIIAGAFDGQGGSRLYRWPGPGHRPEPCGPAPFSHFNPEALIAYPENRLRLQILSDDGTLKIEGQDCKQLANPDLRRFRSLWIAVGTE